MNIRAKLNRLQKQLDKHQSEVPGAIIMTGTWVRDDAGNYAPGADAGLLAVHADGRQRAVREFPDEPVKMYVGVNPFDLV